MPSVLYITSGGSTWSLTVNNQGYLAEPAASAFDSNVPTILLLDQTSGLWYQLGVTSQSGHQYFTTTQVSPSPPATQWVLVAPNGMGWQIAMRGGLLGTVNPAPPDWLLLCPDTKLLDIAANDALFPLSIRQWAQTVLYTRQVWLSTVYNNRVMWGTRSANIAAMIATRQSVQPSSYDPVVATEFVTSEQYSIQQPPPFSPTEI